MQGNSSQPHTGPIEVRRYAISRRIWTLLARVVGAATSFREQGRGPRVPTAVSRANRVGVGAPQRDAVLGLFGKRVEKMARSRPRTPTATSARSAAAPDRGADSAVPLPYRP
jgi:hypothetical protein